MADKTSDDLNKLKLLVAIDGSEASRAALQEATRLLNLSGSQQNTRILLISVQQPIPPLMASGPGVLADEVDAIAQEANLTQLAEQRTQAALQWATDVCQQAGLASTPRFEFGDPKTIICEVAKQEAIDLIIIGSHGYGRVERLLLGSVSDYVVRHAPCPVLVIRQSNS
jgi:nucleotide-binding universal stress UspA family protein